MLSEYRQISYTSANNRQNRTYSIYIVQKYAISTYYTIKNIRNCIRTVSFNTRLSVFIVLLIVLTHNVGSCPDKSKPVPSETALQVVFRRLFCISPAYPATHMFYRFIYTCLFIINTLYTYNSSQNAIYFR